LEAIELLENSGRLMVLPAALREMAELRERYPYMNLAELAEAAGGLSRSAVNHRLRRLLEAAEPGRSSTSSDRMRVLTRCK
jgi:hypothetical protein